MSVEVQDTTAPPVMESAPPGYRKGFWALMVTQFQGAFNDNALKMVITLFLLGYFAGQSIRDYVIPITQALFLIPWILLPGQAGALSDRFSKRRVTIWTKYWELGVMLLVVLAFYYGSPYGLWFLFLLMATQSTFFSPAKYGILPEMLPESRLSWGNGYLQMTTQVAIIAGTAVGGAVLDLTRPEAGGIPIHWAVVPLFLLSIIGVVAAHFVSPVPPADPQKRLPLNPWSGMGRYMKVYASDRWLLLSLLGTIYFWFVGVLALQNILAYGDQALGLQEAGLAMSGLTIALALGIGAGGIAAGYLSGGKIEGGLVPLGAFGLTLFLGLLGIPGWSYGAVLGLLFTVGFCSGFYEIPLAATIQQRSPDDIKGGMLAAMNLLTFVGMAVATGLFALLYGTLDVRPSTIFLVTSVMTLIVGVISVYFVPMYLVRLILWLLTHSLYRLRVLGRENLPVKGGALLVANHTSFIDALAILASIDRPVRFLMAQEIYDIKWIRPFAKAMGALPISPTAGARQIVQSLKEARRAILDGQLVCIFAEGQITRTGQMLPFKKGMERIVDDLPAPIVPVYIDQIWGSVFSYSEGKFFRKLPRRIPYPLTVAFGEPLPSTSSAFAVRRAIQELGSDAWMSRRLETPLLHRGFVRMARRHPFRMAMADMRVEKLSFFKALVGTIALARKLRTLLDDRPMVGIYVPPSVAGALTNIAAQLMGKVAVNLNYTVSIESLQSACDQAEIRHVVTSKAFLEKVPVQPPGEHIYLEDVMASIAKKDRIKALLMAIFCPVRLLERSVGSPGGRTQHDLAAIIFSSGSTGTPKGVMLSHFNILSNIEGALQVFPHEPEECMMGILPFFHSFGFMGTLWLPLTYGFRVVYFPSPLEAKAIGAMCRKYEATFLIGTSTFFQNYIRRCAPEDFSSLKHVVAGAEKLTDRVREAFKAKFGIEPLEGYGTTECAPVVGLNIPNFRAPGFYQVGTKYGSIGHPIPGVSVKTVDPDTMEDLPDGEAGLLFVKGPNIMQGYLKMPEKTAEVLTDGWYNTGDIARIDEDGFVFITDRLARFSKIAGEMVPHTKVEEVLHGLLGLTEQAFAVVGVPDVQKGERLVVLHTVDDEQLQRLLSQLDKSGLPNLWVPRGSSFYRIEGLPVLGTGKLDLQKAKALARDLDVGD
jgi:acyl-[acyl-carrier-protein]-phospholipid O-acyltransferase/long-chain-fatty-acid--[acyl-carrier-protein] ligase